MDSPPIRRGLNVPRLSQSQAASILLAYCLIYVLPLYASSATRISRTVPRDPPDAIKARIFAVSLATAACSIFTLVIFLYLPPVSNMKFASASDPDAPLSVIETALSVDSRLHILHLMGYWPLGLLSACKALCLTAILFLGPLYEKFLTGSWKPSKQLQPLKRVWSDWPTWRNLVAGPITEECLFRSAALPLLLHANFGQAVITFVSPLIFGFAHLHHLFEYCITSPQASLKGPVLRVLLQVTYTSVFGAYATFIFLRTGSLLAVIVVHAFCNCMGFPRLCGTVNRLRAAGVETRPTALLISTLMYYLLLVGGMGLWWLNLYSLTWSASPLALY